MHTTDLVPHGATVKQDRPTKDQQLLAEIETVFRRFMHFPHDHAHTVATLWTAITHLRDQDENFLPRIAPRLYYGSLTAGCGKTMAMELTTLMSFNGEIVVEPTEPGLISKLHNDKATVGLDEIDLYFGSRGTAKSGVRAVLNTGYKRGATIDRERNGETEKRSVAGPVCTAGKNARRFLQQDGPFDTLRSRSIAVVLERKPSGTKLDKYRSEVHEKRLKSISARMARWGMHNAKLITHLNVEPLMPAGIDNRDEEIWTPLFQVASFVGGDWPERVENAARALVLGEWGADDVPQLSPAEELLQACREAFEADEDFLPTRVLLQRLMTVEGWWRQEWTSPRGASMGLADELGTFGIEAGRGYVAGKQERGYALVELLNAASDEQDDFEPVVEPDEWDWDELKEDETTSVA